MPAHTKRFNVMLHGMMLLVEKKDTVEILIPGVANHDFLYGVQPEDPTQITIKQYLTVLPAGNGLTVSGLVGSLNLFRDMIALDRDLMIPASRVSISEPASTLRTKIVLPKPHEVRLFRKLQLIDSNRIFKDRQTRDLLTQLPGTLHESVCFTYYVTEQQQPIQFGDFTFQFDFANDRVFGETVCVYSQADCSASGDDTHTTPINDFMTIVGTNKPPKFDLSFFEPFSLPTVPPVQTAIRANDLRTLTSLNPQGSVSDCGGCTRGCVFIDEL